MEAKQAWASLESPWRICFELMWTAYAMNTIPVGAVLVDAGGKVVATGRNGVYQREGEGSEKVNSLLAHAEVNALSNLDPERRYEDHVMYGSLEPCLLCVGAAAMATIGTIRYGGVDPYAGAAEVTATNPHIGRLNFSVEGPLEDAFGRLATGLHVEFFLRRNPDGHVVRTHRELVPASVELARVLHDADCFGLSQGAEGLEGALPDLWPLVG